ncbi:hypothetical protein F183_A34380 [Bryobacterales bacterium F-183]|nr:hypothetical protein F183_A34380 [Bryobacterales bacterium F-183]
MNASETAVERLRRATVQVLAGRSNGSGVILTQGEVVTNSHVVHGATSVQISLWDGRVLTADVAVRHGSRDLAILKLKQQSSQNLPSAQFASSQTLRAGQFVMAIGNPLGFVGALSTGVVAGTSNDWIQATARLAPGNSGGPLADSEGRVIGINTMVTNRGLGLAVPSDVVQAFLRRPQQAPIGIAVHPSAEGLVITQVKPGSAAAQASLLVGDILPDFLSVERLRSYIEHARDGLRLNFRRGGSPVVRHVTVQLA